jgi:hypothetical protein
MDCILNFISDYRGLVEFIHFIFVILGVMYAAKQFHLSAKAQQDVHAPLLIVTSSGDRIAKSQIKNIGSLCATIAEVSIKITFFSLSDAKEQSAPHAKTSKCLLLESNEMREIFSFPQLKNISPEKVKILKIRIKYISPMRDRVRKYKEKLEREEG